MASFKFGFVFLLGFTLHVIDTAPEKCSPSNCRLPQCFCASREGPESIPKDQLPQIVVLTFDDAVNEDNFEYYKKLLKSTRKNANGCPISATFYVSNEWTNYDMIKSLYLQGHEISSHSITHRFPRDWWSEASYKDWIYEMDGQRNNIATGASVPKSEVRGIRVPFLQLGGNTQYSMLTDRGFQYDASCITGPYSGSDRRLPVWPFTLDFSPELEFCDSNGRPSANFSGFWEVPLNRWIGLDGKVCPMVDACTTQELNDKGDALRYLETNFKRHYLDNRAPFGINMHAVWFKEEHRFDAMNEFIEYLTRLDDVWIVTVYQMIEWMRNPTANSKLKSFEPWQSCRKPIKLLRPRKSESISEDQGSPSTSGSREEPEVELKAGKNSDEAQEILQDKPNRVEEPEERDVSDIQANQPSKWDPIINDEEKELVKTDNIKPTTEEKSPPPNGRPRPPVRTLVLRDESRNIRRGNGAGPVSGSKPGSSTIGGRPNSRSSNGRSSSAVPTAVCLPPGTLTTIVILVTTLVLSC